jgi:hypothetical protein
MREILAFLGLAPYGGNYETVRRRAELLGLELSRRRITCHGRALSDCSDADVATAVANSRSLRQVLEALGIRQGRQSGTDEVTDRAPTP